MSRAWEAFDVLIKMLVNAHTRNDRRNTFFPENLLEQQMTSAIDLRLADGSREHR